jgi:hypothetical protein
MSTTYVQTGKLKTVIAVTNSGAHLGHGNWKSYPVSSVPKNTDYTQIFLGDNEGSSTICTDGYVVYVAADGSKFTLSWNCTMSGKNEISFSADPLVGPWEHGEVYATGGFNSSYYWEIAQKAGTFIDAPVFAEDILKAERCHKTSQAEVEKYIDGRKCIYLRDCFENGRMRTHEKIWCVISPLFLTPISKSVLLRELAEHAVGKMGTKSMGGLTDKLLSYNQGISEGKYSIAEATELRVGLQNVLTAEENADNNSLIGVASSLLTTDLEKGWREGVQSYLSTQDEEELIKRQNKLLDLVEAHLS